MVLPSFSIIYFLQKRKAGGTVYAASAVTSGTVSGHSVTGGTRRAEWLPLMMG